MRPDKRDALYVPLSLIAVVLLAVPLIIFYGALGWWYDEEDYRSLAVDIGRSVLPIWVALAAARIAGCMVDRCGK